MTGYLLAIILACLAAIETPHGVPRHPGLAGETGRWQLTPAVRRERGAELRRAGMPTDDRSIARAQILWIRAQFLEARGREPSVYEIAEAWNGGIHALLQDRVPHASRDFARRLNNLVQEQLHP